VLDFAHFSRGGPAWEGCAASPRVHLSSPREAGRMKAPWRFGRLPQTPWQTGMRRRKMRSVQLQATLMLPHDNCYTRRATV